MGKAEEIHKLIYTNLCLLGAAGHRIDFKQDMFKEHNLPGFEAVGYALLMIIDPTECKSKIPWPLVNDKAQTREFRTSFTKFIKMINSRYPDAKIPEITASTLQFPGGLNFLCFMYKLSTFALELELKKMLSSEERQNFLPKLLSSKQSKDQLVKLKTVTGARCREEMSLLQFKDYEAEGPLMLQKLNDCLCNITENHKSVTELLKLEVSSLDFDDSTKMNLLDIEDSVAITDYNEQIEKKREELESNSLKLSQLHILAAQCCQQGRTSLQTHEQTQCVDGHKLGFTRFLNELAGGPMVNVDGDVKLLEVLRASRNAIDRLTSRTSGSPPPLSQAQELQGRCSSLAAKACKIESVLHQLSQENKQTIQTLRPLVYSSLKNKKIPVAFKHLKAQPLNVVLPQLIANTNMTVKPGKTRKSFGTIIQRKNKVVCSYRMRREPRKHVSSTPIFKTPACRKSLYNTLPSGTRHKPVEEDKSLEVTPDNPVPLPQTPALSSTRESVVSEPSPFNSCFTNEISSTHPTPAVRCGRKSLNDIVARFLKLKSSMNMSSNSKNESDTCDKSET